MWVSFILSQWMSVEFFESVVNPIQYIVITTICFYGAWLLIRHIDGLQVRRSWSGVLILWGCINVALLVLRHYNLITVGIAGSEILVSASIVIGNVLGWFLYIYPTQILCPGYLNIWRALLQLLPMILLGLIDAFIDLDLRPLIALYPVFIFIHPCGISAHNNHLLVFRFSLNLPIRAKY